MGQVFTQLGRQLLGIWKQLGVSQRLSVALAAVVVAGGLIGLSMWSSQADYGLLYGKLDDAESGKVVAALDDAKVPYRVSRTGGAIYVPADKVYQMRMQLASKGIPKSGDGVGFEIFDKPNFGISDFVQRANYLRALQGELARTISQLDQVEAARVMIVMPENRLLVDTQKKPTASVFVRVKGSADLPASAVNSIRFLVANSVEGLQPSGVSVVDNRGNVLSGNDESDSLAGLSANQMNARRSIEQYLSQKAQSMLEKVVGAGQTVVRVAVELDTETINRTEEKFDPEGQVARTTTSTEETSDSTTGNNGGVAGVAANAGTETNTTVTGSNNNRTRRKTTNNQFEINKSVSTILNVPGGLKRISAAVFVAAKVEGTGAERKAVPRTADELDKLRKIVQSALGLQLGAEAVRKDEITLEEMSFNDTLTVEVAQQLDKQQKQVFWWEIGKNALYLLVAIVLIFAFWRGLKGASAETVAFNPPAGSGGARTREGVVTPEVLNRLIRENPANVNQAVRSWLTQSGSQRN